MKAVPPGSPRSPEWLQTVALLLLCLALAPFGFYALKVAASAFDGAAVGAPYLFVAGAPWSNAGMLVHVTAGALLTCLVPLQLLGGLRRRHTALHRATGVLLVAMAVPASLGGLVYIALRGTVGGPAMSTGFALYGAFVLVAAVQVARSAARGDRDAHWQWALRLFWLAIASWLYRVHYGLWYLATGGAASNRDFTGAFDRVQNFAFFVPYLILVQLWIAYRSPRRAAARSG